MADRTAAAPATDRRWWQRGDAEHRPETREDMRRYVEDGLVPIACTQCRTTVLVKKNSPKHTSVQWTTDATRSCPEIAAQVAAGAQGAQILGCSALKRSIADAVRSGTVTVPDE